MPDDIREHIFKTRCLRCPGNNIVEILPGEYFARTRDEIPVRYLRGFPGDNLPSMLQDTRNSG